MQSTVSSMAARSALSFGRCFLALALAVTASEVRSQTQLPGIVVTTPSPVAQPRPTPQAQAPAPAPKAPASKSASTPPAKQATPAPAPVATAPPPAALPPAAAPPPGSIIVIDDAFAPITVVTAREIAATPSASLGDTLFTKPGVTGSSFAPGASRPVIRGLDNYRVRVQENGIGSHDVSALSEDHAVPVDPFAADQIEVVRGPATLRYGSQAIGGVVNATNSRIPEFAPKGGLSAEVKGGLNSVDHGRDGGFKATAGAGNFAVHADAFRRNSSDYATPHGRQANSFVESEGHSFGGSLIWAHGFAGVAYSRTASLYGIPGGAEALTQRPRIDMEQEKIQSKGEWRVRDFGLEAIRYWFGASDYAHSEVVGEGEIGSRFTNREQEGRIEVQHMPIVTSFGELRGAVGVQWGRRHTRAQSFEGDGLLDPATRSTSTAGFLFEELRASRRLRLQVAARIETSEAHGVGVLDPTGAAEQFEGAAMFRPVSGSIGALYELPLAVVARVTAQHTERAPDATELFSRGVHEATGTFEIGAPGLTIEKADSLEVGLKRAKGDLRFDASAYYTRYKGFIYKQLTGRQCDETLASCSAGAELDELVFSQRDAIFRGAEVAAQLDVAQIWRGVWGIDGQYDFVRATFDTGENVPRIPPHRLGGGLFYRDGNWFAHAGALHAFRQDKVGENETSTSGYTLLSADLAYTWKLDPAQGIVPEMTIGLKGDNLLDEDVRNHVSFKKDEVLLPGRTIRLYGSVKLN